MDQSPNIIIKQTRFAEGPDLLPIYKQLFVKILAKVVLRALKHSNSLALNKTIECKTGSSYCFIFPVLKYIA